MTNLTTAEIIEFSSRLIGLRPIEVETKGRRRFLKIVSDKGAPIYTATEDAEALAWLCGYVYSAGANA